MRQHGGTEHEAAGSAGKKRFAARVESLLAATPASKAEWGILVVDGATGETLFERNADRYFVAASNLKLFITALDALCIAMIEELSLAAPAGQNHEHPH